MFRLLYHITIYLNKIKNLKCLMKKNEFGCVSLITIDYDKDLSSHLG